MGRRTTITLAPPRSRAASGDPDDSSWQNAIAVTVKQLKVGDRILVMPTARGPLAPLNRVHAARDGRAFVATILLVDVLAPLDRLARTRGQVTVDTDHGPLGALPHNTTVLLVTPRAYPDDVRSW